MRPYAGTNPQAITDPTVRSAVMALHDFALQLNHASGAQSNVYYQGTTVVGGSGGVTVHNQLAGLGADDHRQYLLLAGRAGGQTILPADTTNPALTVRGSSNSTTSVQRWYNNILDTSLDLRVVGGATPAVSLFTDSGTGLYLTAGGTTVGVQISSVGCQFIGGKMGVGTLSSSPTLLAVDSAAVSTVVADSDDCIRVIRRSATQTGHALRVMEQTRTTTLASISATGALTGTGSLALNGSTSGTITVSAGVTPSNHTLTLPSANASGVLTNNGSGSLSWAAASSSNALLDGSNHTDTTNSACTRGDLVYGNSSAQWDDLAIGSANTVLVSNGTDPSWGTISKSHIDNRTRSFFLPAAVFSTTATSNRGTAPDIMGGKTCGGVSPVTNTTTAILPMDYVSLGSCYIYYSSQGTSTNNVVWNFYSKRVENSDTTTGAYTGSTTVVVTAPSGTADVMVVALISGTTNTFMTGYSAGDAIRVVVQRDPGDGSDTNADSMSFHGIKIEYTADM